MIYNITDINSLPAVANNLIQKYKHINIWAFKGEMGMGKTTLIKQNDLNLTDKAIWG